MKELLKESLKTLGGWCLWLVVSLYVTFVLQTLLNWFATPALHVENISYWNMYGLVLITTVVRLRNLNIGEIQREHRTTTMLEACIPEEKRVKTMKLLEEGAARFVSED